MKYFDRIVHTIIVLENIPILYDIFVNHGAISWPKIAFLLASILLLCGLWFLYYRADQTKVASPSPSLSTSNLLTNQAKEIARSRISQLTARGDYLSKNKPLSTAGASSLAKFWNEQAQQWTQDVSALLMQYWSQQDGQNFLSLKGENPHQFAIGVHLDSVQSWIELNRRLRNLEQIKTS